MSEYIDYPHALHIDASFGAEYDPYPGSRIPRAHPSSRPAPSWISTGNALSTSTPKLTPTINATSPVPAVHRLTNAEPDPTRTPGRSPVSAVHSPMPGGSRFRELDQPEPTRWTSPTNVSFPVSHRPSWLSNNMQPPPMRTGDGASLFAPLQASTPTPTRYGDPRPYGEHSAQYAQNPYQPAGRYRTIADDDHEQERPYPSQTYDRTPEEPSYSSEPPRREVDEDDLEEEMRPHSGSDEGSEEEFMTINQTFVDEPEEDESVGYEAYEPPISHDKPKGKRFVGGFMAGLKNLAGLRPKTPSRAPSQPQFPIPQPETAPLHARRRPSANNLLGQGQPPSAQRPSDSPRDQGDRTLSTDRTMSTDGPITPNQSTELPGTIPDLPEDVALPNPYQRAESQVISELPIAEEPLQVDLQPTADYDAMSEPIEDNLPETTFSSHINRVGKFLNDLTHLPWISPTSSTAPYKPAESRRARYATQKPGTSWYTKENHEKLDLLATPTQQRPSISTRPRANTTQGPANRPARRPRAPLSGGPSTTSLDAVSAIRPTRTLTGTTSAGVRPTSPATSSHGNGQQSMSYNYYYATPQPLYVYPSSMTSPQTGGGGRSGLDAPMAMPYPIPLQMANTPGATGQQAVPVYMLATPAPLVMPRSSHRKRSGRRHTNEAIQMPMPQTTITAASSPRMSPPTQPRSPPAQRATSPKSPAVTNAQRSPSTRKSPAAAKSPTLSGSASKPP